jgi:hypothetical protein
LLWEFVSRIEEACGGQKDFIVILKYAKREEAIKKILGKCGVEGTFLGIFTKGRYKGRELSVFRTGKLIIKGLKEKKEAEEILEELLI